MPSFNTLWSNLPTQLEYPCDQSKYTNQCAIRMSVAFQKSNIDVSRCPAVKCDFSISTHKSPKHFLRAQELANWIKDTGLFGKTHTYSRSELNKAGGKKKFKDRKGIIFIEDGWGPTDHIDLWNGHLIKNGSDNYFEKGIRIWFWDIL